MSSRFNRIACLHIQLALKHCTQQTSPLVSGYATYRFRDVMFHKIVWDNYEKLEDRVDELSILASRNECGKFQLVRSKTFNKRLLYVIEESLESSQ